LPNWSGPYHSQALQKADLLMFNMIAAGHAKDIPQARAIIEAVLNAVTGD
jgi:hypothetical protein